MIEIELKARVGDPTIVEARLNSFLSFVGTVEKHDEYWSIPVLSSMVLTTGFRFRIRHEAEKTLITFKEKTYTNTIEVNREVEFGVQNEAAFRKFIEKMSARYIYSKQKKGKKWKGEGNLLAELVAVEGLGNFLEVEMLFEDGSKVKSESVKKNLIEIIERCGLSASDIEPRPYSQLLGMPKY